MSEAQKFFSDGGAYERQMGRWSRLVGEKFLDWLDLPKGLRCLDVGCGNGAFTELLIARSAPGSVMALDPSEDQVAFARQRDGQWRSPNFASATRRPCLSATTVTMPP